MEYLRVREQKLRDTNESTNSRVKYFGVATTWLLVGLWAWQIMYLRAYFRYVASTVLREDGRWFANGVLGPSILSELGSKGARDGLAVGRGCLEFDVNDMGRAGQGLCSGCRITDRKYDSHSVLVHEVGGLSSSLDAARLLWRCVV